MVNKTWTATDLVLGKLTIHRLGNDIQLERRYQFANNAGDILTQIAGSSVVEVIAIVDIPANILSALQAIDNWTKLKALKQEGMG